MPPITQNSSKSEYMEEKTKRNDNKVLKLKGSKELLELTINLGDRYLTKDEKIILKEVLINDKTFAELKIKTLRSKHIPRFIFLRGYSRLKKGLIEMNTKIEAQEKTISELINANKFLAFKLNDIMDKCDLSEKTVKQKSK